MVNNPLTVHFEVTNRCNNSCPHCYASSWLYEEGPSVKLIDVANKISENEIFSVVITGGEPTLIDSEILRSIMDVFNKNNIDFSLNTNGRLLHIDYCKELISFGLSGLLISLHSSNDNVHNEFVDSSFAAEETKRGIRNALNAGLTVSVNQVISSKNIHTMFETSKYLEGLGVHKVSFSRLISPMGVDYKLKMIDSRAFIDEFIKCKDQLSIPCSSLVPIPYCADERVKDLKENLSCTGGITSAAVSCLGDVRFCPQDSKVWGNILKEDLSQIWSRISAWRSTISIPEECEECSFVEDCKGGCRISNIESDRYDLMDPWASKPLINYVRTIIYKKFEVDQPYYKTTNVHYRKENGEFLLSYNQNFMKVNLDGLNFFQSLPQILVPEEIIKNSNDNSEKQLEFMEVLYQRGLISKCENLTKETDHA